MEEAYVYKSHNYMDDLAWGASWLFRKTGEDHFLQVRILPMRTLPFELVPVWSLVVAMR